MVRNSCDGCRIGMPTRPLSPIGGKAGDESKTLVHVNERGHIHMVCTKERYSNGKARQQTPAR